MSRRVMLRVAAVLWAMWGLLHLAAGLSVMSVFARAVTGVPESVMLSVMGGALPFEVRRTLAEHQFNNSWFGLVVLVGSVLVWRGSRTGLLLCTVVGGLAHLGFTQDRKFQPYLIGHLARPLGKRYWIKLLSNLPMQIFYKQGQCICPM